MELLEVRASCRSDHREDPVQSLGIELDVFRRNDTAAPTNLSREEITLLWMKLEVILMADMEQLVKDL